MTMLLNKVVNAFAVSLVLVCGSVINVGVSLAKDSLPVTPQAAVIASAATQCPTDLTSLQPNMKKALQFIKSATFRNTMLASLEASIPEAISQSDGLAQQIVFLKREIARQEQERAMLKKSREKDSLIRHNHSSRVVIGRKVRIAMRWINISSLLPRILRTKIF